MRLSFRTDDDVTIVSVAGIVDNRTAGQLFNALAGCIGRGSRKLVVDLSGVHVVTRAGVRGFIAAARLMQNAGGHLRICAAIPPVGAYLQSLGFSHLLKCDPTLREPLAQLRGRGSRRDGDTATAVPFRTPAPSRMAAQGHRAD